jgi:hypothetical protein
VRRELEDTGIWKVQTVSFLFTHHSSLIIHHSLYVTLSGYLIGWWLVTQGGASAYPGLCYLTPPG